MSLARLIMLFGGAMTVSASPATASGTTNFAGMGNCTTNTVTAVVSGGSGPYTYAWSHLSGAGFTINSPSSATTSFFATVSPGVISGVARCTVTSADGQQATVDVPVTMTNIYTTANPPTWAVANGTTYNWARGQAQAFSVYATLGGFSITYSWSGPSPAYTAGESGPGPRWASTGETLPSGPQTDLYISGTPSAGLPIGSYSFLLTALNGSDGSSSQIVVYVNVTP